MTSCVTEREPQVGVRGKKRLIQKKERLIQKKKSTTRLPVRLGLFRECPLTMVEMFYEEGSRVLELGLGLQLGLGGGGFLQ